MYFTVVSLTTVGFGDYIPAQAGSQSHRVTIQFYRFMNTVWLLMGLLVSAILAEFQSIYKAVGNFFRIHNCCKLVKKKMVERQELESLDSSQKETSSKSNVQIAVSDKSGVKEVAENV